jgi:hypothetical protein
MALAREFHKIIKTIRDVLGEISCAGTHTLKEEAMQQNGCQMTVLCDVGSQPDGSTEMMFYVIFLLLWF